MTATGQDVTMYAGDDHVIRYTVTDETGTALDLTGCTIEWTMRNGGGVVLSKTIGSGITVVSLTGGVFDVVLAPDDTKALEARAYAHGAVVSVDAGEYDTVSVGTLTLNARVRS